MSFCSEKAQNRAKNEQTLGKVYLDNRWLYEQFEGYIQTIEHIAKILVHIEYMIYMSYRKHVQVSLKINTASIT